MRLLLSHQSHYQYEHPTRFGPHTVRLRPAAHARARIETHSLSVEQPCELRWQQDPAGNYLARLSFREGERFTSLDVLVELAVDIRPVNPFDFFVDPEAEEAPFRYPDALVRDLAPYLETHDPAYAAGERFRAFSAELPHEGRSVDLVVALNRAVHSRLAYVLREESGVFTPEQALAEGRASCRDSAVLLVALLRSRGLAARFVSGYLVQLTDEGMIPDEPRGVGRDVVDLHAWAEVYLPGAGWVGLDATSGLLTGEGHIPLACTARPAAAAPIEGTSDRPAARVRFDMKLMRLGHEPRPTAPFTEETWRELVASAKNADARLVEAGLALTVGGEPTFTSRLHPERPEWLGEALGPTKWQQALVLSERLRERLAPGGVLLHGTGKLYPGESLPRWKLELVWRADGAPLADLGPAGRNAPEPRHAEELARALSERLGLARGLVRAAYEDPWHYLLEEARLPVGVDPFARDLTDSEERRRLALLLERGLGSPSGFVLPIAAAADGGWLGDAWSFRRERLYLVPGDSPVGLRLPLSSIRGAPPPLPEEPEYPGPPDPRRRDPEGQTRERTAGPPVVAPGGIRTALATELRGGTLYVFLPPLPSAARFVELVEHVDAAARELGVRVALEGYPPPRSPELCSFAVTPDPGVLEVNVPPSASFEQHLATLEAVFDAALGAGLCAEKWQLDGRPAGSGGGNHITLGGPSTRESPFLRRPDLLASLITFAQHHPSLSYLMSGLFVGPTSQAPRVDEARHDSLAELEIALARAFAPERDPAPWLSDSLFRHLLVDVTGNTHRAEICIDKLFDPASAHGRQGLLELRAFEMPPHVRMAAAQIALVRALVASFAREPYRAPLARWGRLLHDRFLLPFWLWRDFLDVLEHLERTGVPLPRAAYRVFIEHRCPVIGRLEAGDVAIELRNAIEPWNVLGEEMVAGGTSRFVDSSMERVEVRSEGLVPERHAVIVNGCELPLLPTGAAGEFVVGVRFRAWAPPHSLHPHLGIHHPLRFEIVDRWGKRSLGAAAYHVWHPEGRAFDVPPLTRFEASARRAQRFTFEGPSPWPVQARRLEACAEAPYSVDLRRFDLDHPMPEPPEEADEP